MKREAIIGVVALLAIVFIGFASATTLIAGKIYDGPNFETASGVPGAIVAVTCNGTQQNVTSLSDGTYSTPFDTAKCGLGSALEAYAQKGGVTSAIETATIHDYSNIQLDFFLGVINIALIPEFGVIAGALTLVSAVGIFFLVRKKI